MDINALIPSKFLKQSDLGDEEKTVTVESVQRANVALETEAPEYKYTVKFREFEKPLVLNSTNIKRMGKALGSDTDDWIGNQVKLFVDHDVEFKGETVGGLRVRALTRPSQRSTTGPRQPSMDDINRDLNRQADDDNEPIPF